MYFCRMDVNSKFIIEPYSADNVSAWNDFVDLSRNATFLLRRDYMDYHADRFADRSLMIYRMSANGKRQLSALFAACLDRNGEISAHAGLTYGGLLLPHSVLGGQNVLTIMKMICEYYHAQGYRRLTYKSIPHIYHRYPAEEDIYALFRCGARLTECNLSSAIDLRSPIKFNENSLRNKRRAISAGVPVRESRDYNDFWPILETLLCEKYATSPVHSIDEITLLASRFPDDIRLITAYDCTGKPLAGSVLYFTPSCVHAQYIASSPEGKRLGALCMLFSHVIDKYCGNARYFDFGTSNEDHGRYLNEGLLNQKNGMGGRGITYNIYDIDL